MLTSPFRVAAFVIALGTTCAALAASRLPAIATSAVTPLRFEENRGQTDRQVRYLCRNQGGTIFLTSTEVVVSGRADNPIRIELLGAKTRAVSGEGLLSSVSNYIIGNDPSRWRSGIANYSAVRYRGVYRGVDLRFHGDGNQLEYDWIVAPGSDPTKIRMRLGGAKRLRIVDGDLVIDTARATLRMQKPVVYQESRTSRDSVAAELRISDDNILTFRVGDYDRARPLVIDPVLSYSTYLGGSGLDNATGIAVDSSGNAYVTGSTTSTDFPTVNAVQATMASTGGFQDVFVTKLNAAGSALVYSTYLGGSSDDAGAAIAVDSAGSAYITGYTTSTNYPIANQIQTSQVVNGFPDAFVTKLNAAGSALVYSTYLGGNTGSENGYDIAVDTSGNAYVTGFTGSGNFPVTAGAVRATAGSFSDAFVTKINAAGTALSWSSYFGGTNGSNKGHAIAADAAGNIYVAGETNASNFPATAGAFQTTRQSTGNALDAFVARITPGGSPVLVYATYLGGKQDDDTPKDIAIDSSGNAYITGFVISTDYPTANAIQATHGGSFQDAFLTKLNSTGSALIYSTYLGGSGTDNAFGIALDANGIVFLTGSTTSTNFPTANAIQQTKGTGSDAWIAKINAAGSAFIYSTYLGGAGSDNGYDVSLDPSGNAYVVGAAGSGFPTLNPIQASYAGSIDAFIAKIVDQSAPAPPAGLVATAAGKTQVNLTWSAVPNATSYEIWRSTSGPNAYSLLSPSDVNSYSDGAVTADKSYLYKVLAVGAGGKSGFSNVDAATTIVFTNDPLSAGLLVRALHVTEARTAVNALRVAAGLPQATFTVPLAIGTTIQAVHVQELRTALNQARTQATVGALSFNDGLAAGSLIRAIHVQQIRNGVK